MTRSEEDEDRFRPTVARVAMLASLAPPEDDLAFVAAELAKADAFGVFTDPTAWRKSQKDREALTPFIDASRKFAAAAEAFATARGEILAHRSARPEWWSA